MASPERKRLRELVSDYYHGLIALESYRQQRAELLDNLGQAGNPAADVTARRQTADTAPAPRPEPEVARPASAARWPLWSAIGGLAIVGAGLAIFWLTRTPDDAVSGTVPMQPAAPPSAAAGNAGEDILLEFLARNDWSARSIGGFVDRWQALNDEQREQSRSGQAFRRLTTALNRRLREESALGTPATDPRVLTLTALAAELDIGYRETPAVIENVAPGDPPADAPPPEAAAEIRDTNAAANPDPVAASPEALVEAPSRPVAEPRPAPVATTRTDSEEPAPAAEAVAGPSGVPANAPHDPCLANLANTRRPYCQDLLGDGSEGPPLVVLPVGQFAMGSTLSASEAPQHTVTIDRPIAMTRYEITVGEYARYCAAAGATCPGNGADEDLPVVQVSWEDAVAYAKWLSTETGFSYRLPSESEWEFAARAGTDTPYFFGDEITPSNAHSIVNGDVDAPLPRGDRLINRNPFRLYHMSGNVREWVQDSWHADHAGAPGDGSARIDGNNDLKVVRGGSYLDPGIKLRSAARESLTRTHRDRQTGFRVVRDIVK